MNDRRISRRAFSKLGLSAGVIPLLGGSTAWGQNPQEEHFFLQVIFGSGVDQSYMFDARPLAMTAAGKIQNYLGQEPDVWQAPSGQKTLASPLTRPLKHLAQDMTIINGVHMAQDFAGHGQNLNYLLSGNPFGGEWFGPYISQKSSSSLDFLQLGALPDTTLTNAGNSLDFDPKGAKALASTAHTASSLDTSPTLSEFILRRMELAGRGQGGFSQGSRLMHKGLSGQSQLVSYFSKINNFDDSDYDQSSSVYPAMNVINKYFRSGFTRSVIFAPEHNVDTHDAKSASTAPQLYSSIIEDIKGVLDFLKETPYDDQRSLLDVTTVCIASEFGRTMTQKSKSVDHTGTNHNPLGNSVIMAGKNVVTGQIIGQTDLQTLEEFHRVSGAHTQKDRHLLSVMGVPYDYVKGRSLVHAMPETYEPNHYIHFANIANSILNNFGIHSNKMWKKEVTSALPAPVIPGLFKS